MEQISDSSVDLEPARSSVGKIVARIRERDYDKETVMRRAIGVLVVCAAVGLLSRYTTELGWISGTARELIGLIALAGIWAVAFYVFSLIATESFVRRCLLVGVFCLFLYQLSDIVDEFPYAYRTVLFNKNEPIHRLIHETLVIVGSAFLLAGVFGALLNNDNALRQLAYERRRLAENIAARRQAKRALKEAHRILEKKVEERTAELEERNQQLRMELSERKRAEATLAMRLRYEEGLAACSSALLAEARSEDALGIALQQLLMVSGADRVYIAENVDDPERGRCMKVTHWAAQPEHWGDWGEKRPLEPYAGGLERWAAELSHGGFITGDVSVFPDCEQERLGPYGVQSILLLPLFWDGQWRGVLGFEDLRTANGWTTDEIRVLRTAAQMVGAYMQHRKSEESLRRAYDSLERRVEERTADLTRTNAKLEQEVAVRRMAEKEKARLESQLSQAQKMEAIGTLAGGIAHDFNNILVSILGYTELALRKMESENPFRRHFEEVLKAANRAKELVRQILIFSRQVEQNETPVHVHLIAKEVLALIRASCPANIEIRHHINSSAGAVLADPVQIHQVILNLCTNALHAMKRNGGTLKIFVESARLDAPMHTPHGDLVPGDYVKIIVSDTGHGMDPQIAQRIFEPFFTTKGVGEGTGMGLAILHGIVTSHNGAVLVRSAPNAGATFEVFLPKYHSEKHVQQDAVAEIPHGNERIMVVDDEQQLVALWTEILEQLGYRVTPFCESLEALEAFRNDPYAYDMVLLDQIMPGMTGAQLAQVMVKTRPELPIVLATGFSETITPEQAHEMGIRGFVYKPILASELGQIIRNALENNATPADTAPGVSHDV